MDIGHVVTQVVLLAVRQDVVWTNHPRDYWFDLNRPSTKNKPWKMNKHTSREIQATSLRKAEVDRPLAILFSELDS
jgi:hypothetical protein